MDSCPLMVTNHRTGHSQPSSIHFDYTRRLFLEGLFHRTERNDLLCLHRGLLKATRGTYHFLITPEIRQPFVGHRSPERGVLPCSWTGRVYFEDIAMESLCVLHLLKAQSCGTRTISAGCSRHRSRHLFEKPDCDSRACAWLPVTFLCLQKTLGWGSQSMLTPSS